MKNRELMRLNKVLHKGEVKTIDCISPGYVSFIEDVPKDADFGPWVDLDEVEFIETTAEELVKLGFSKKSETDYDKGLLHLVINDSYHKKGRVYFNSWAILNETPKYIHHLQNLCFVLGEELQSNAI